MLKFIGALAISAIVYCILSFLGNYFPEYFGWFLTAEFVYQIIASIFIGFIITYGSPAMINASAIGMSD